MKKVQDIHLLTPEPLVKTNIGDLVTPCLYKCAICGAEDTYKLFPGEIRPPIINCWSCKAGQGMMKIGEQIAHKRGMFPVGDS